MIRRATVEDIRAVYDMIEGYYREAAERYPQLKFDREKVVIQLGNWLWNTETGFSFIDDEANGMLLGELMETWWGGDKIGNIRALYVKPEHRNGLLARNLLRTFEQHVEARGAIGATWDNFGGISTPKMLDPFARACGYSVHGSLYLKLLGGFCDERHGIPNAIVDGARN
jgi:GNAT superfamily N-acetyltransferase